MSALGPRAATVKCPCCGAAIELSIQPARPDPPAAPAAAPPTPAAGPKTAAQMSLCGCGHERAHHWGVGGQCQYGLDSLHGRCGCDGFHSRRRGLADARKELAGGGAGPDAKPLGKCERALLAVLTSRSPHATTRTQLAILSGYSQKSSSFENALSALRTAKLITNAGAREFLPTDAGRARAGSVVSMPQPGPDLVDYWCKALDKCPRTLLRVLADSPRTALGRAALAIAAQYSETSSSFENGLSKLRSLGLIEQPGRGFFCVARALVGEHS